VFKYKQEEPKNINYVDLENESVETKKKCDKTIAHILHVMYCGYCVPILPFFPHYSTEKPVIIHSRPIC